MLLTKIIERDCKYNVIYLHKLNKDNVHLFIMYEQLCDQAGLRNWTDYVFSDYGEKSEQTHLWGDLGLDCKLRDGLLQQWFVQLRLLSALRTQNTKTEWMTKLNSTVFVNIQDAFYELAFTD